ncbi:unnamed protein product [Blepharisma stoltei]|uniref:Uncharacterized protein n=1 Tax=Blepharisma stoltei TaxID=1481888 RepID=A0AAU9K398_9CILI|nr:unnamed protein product [Blepharisma stoltei]
MDFEDFCCNICEESYNSTDREPLILQCGHTFCSACLRLMFSRGQLICPEDRGALTVRHLDELPKNYALLRLLSKSPPKTEKNLCQSHKRQLEYICLDDRQKVCANCVLFGDHKGHEIKQFEELLHEFSMKTETLSDMLQTIEKSLILKIEKDIKQRLDTIYENFQKKKAKIDTEIKKGFQNLKNKLSEIERSTVKTFQTNCDYIEKQIYSVREIPRKIYSQALTWKDRTKKELDRRNEFFSYENYANLDIMCNDDSRLLEIGEKVLVELENLKDLKVDYLSNAINDISVEFSEELLYNACSIKPYNRIDDLKEIISKINPFKCEPENEIISPKAQFNEEVFNQALDVLKFHTCNVADFSGAGDIGDRAIDIAPYLVNNSYLKSLKLIKNNISDAASCEIFKALQENTALQSLHLSRNPLGVRALNGLIELLNVNSTLRDIYLIGNPRMSFDYKTRFSQLSNKFRKIHT